MEGKCLCHKTTLWKPVSPRIYSCGGNLNTKWHLPIQAPRMRLSSVAMQMSVGLYLKEELTRRESLAWMMNYCIVGVITFLLQRQMSCLINVLSGFTGNSYYKSRVRTCAWLNQLAESSRNTHKSDTVCLEMEELLSCLKLHWNGTKNILHSVRFKRKSYESVN